MKASQVIYRSDGSSRTVPGIGALVYNRSPDHSHWHYAHFERYELRRAADYSLVAPDRKTGFCLADSYRPDSAAAPAEPIYRDQCARGKRYARHVREGISVGFVDPYPAWVDGQYIDITGVPSGRYLLVHLVNADHALEESHYSNNAASVLFALKTHPHRPPTLRYLRGCPSSRSCADPRAGAPTQDSRAGFSRR